MTVRLAEKVVEFLSLENDAAAPKRTFNASPRDWKRTLNWLDDSGLSLYFLQRLKQAQVTESIPAWVLNRLEQSMDSNRIRVDDMARQFEILNRDFANADVHYAVVKGLSLIPQFCPDEYLRHQSDFDYLVDAASIAQAKQALEQRGYHLYRATSTELKFVVANTKTPSRQEQYNRSDSYVVELHLSLWDAEGNFLHLSEQPFLHSSTRMHTWRDSVFPVLPDEDVFLLQVIHAFQHILGSWIRLSWLYEIGHFLRLREKDPLFWYALEAQIGKNDVLREVVALISSLTVEFFHIPLPPTIAKWVQELRPPVRIWIQKYARTWVFGKNRVDEFSLLPTSKLVLFLHQQYVADQERFVRARLFPTTRLARIGASIRKTPATAMVDKWRARDRLVRRSFFHLAANLRYLWEKPRWRRLNLRRTPTS